MIDILTEGRLTAIRRAYSDKGSICIVPVLHSHEGASGPALGVAVANERGYYPIPHFYYSADTYDEASARADVINEAWELSSETVAAITASTMGGKFYQPDLVVKRSE